MAGQESIPGGEDCRPLSGLRVVEVSSYLATPLAGLNLAQLGAEVIRVEPLAGAPDRTRWPVAASGESLYWTGLNRGKKSLAVDLDDPRGAEIVAELVVSPASGILVINTDRYPALRYDALAARRPDIIHALLTGRPDGSSSVDYLVQARSGLSSITGHPDGPDQRPVNHALPAWDLLAGSYLAISVLAANHRRTVTGAGEELRLSLEDVAVSTLTTLGWYPDVLCGGTRMQLGNEVYGTTGLDVVTQDGARFMVVVLTPRHWRDLLRFTGLTERMALTEERLGVDFADEGVRFEHRGHIHGAVRSWFAGKTREEARAVLSSSKLLWEEFMSFFDGARLALKNPLVAKIDQPGVGDVMASGFPVHHRNSREPTPGPSPRIGADGDEILRDALELDEAEWRRLVEGGVVGRGPSSGACW